ncbi:MAG TPA: hypothetical protein PLY93_15240, partial [Turneriella sp.]|nr:hypothetical protein [Turneriella sp.]
KRSILIALLCLHTGVLSATVRGGRFGVEFGYGDTVDIRQAFPQTVYVGTPGASLWYHFTDWIAITVRMGFRTNSANGSIQNLDGVLAHDQGPGLFWGTSVEVPFYIAEFHSIHLYVAPGAGYTLQQSKYYLSSRQGEFFRYFATTGIQIPVIDQLHLVGRITFGYIHGSITQNTQDNSESVDLYPSYMGLQSWSLGAIIYLN